MNYLLGIFLIFSCANLSFAQQASLYALPAGSLVPETKETRTVDLSSLFQEQIQIQNGGSCHIYSSTAFLEAFCFKATGRRLKLSEPYFFYQHLRTEMIHHGAPEYSSGGFFGNIEGGKAANTIERFLKGRALLASEFRANANQVVAEFTKIGEYNSKANDELRPKYQSDAEAVIKAHPTNSITLGSNLDRLKNTYNGIYQSRMMKNIDSATVSFFPNELPVDYSAKNGLFVKSTHKTLQACEKLAKDAIYPIANPSQHQMIQILDAGSPILCEGYFTFQENLINTNTLFSNGGHVTHLRIPAIDFKSFKNRVFGA